jgi:hypothetical protein
MLMFLQMVWLFTILLFQNKMDRQAIVASAGEDDNSRIFKI